jgi:hypothetical protein
VRASCRRGSSPAANSTTDSPDIEYESTLDADGRFATVRWRAAEFGAQPAGRWYTSTYRYPSARQFAGLAGPTPGPRCR